MLKLVFFVLFVRTPAEIRRRIILRISVSMKTNQPRRTRPPEEGQHEAGDGKTLGNAAAR
jgi:hypothetical protein